MSLEAKRLLAFADFEVDASQRLLFRRGENVPLPPKVFQTLLVFVESGGRLLTKDELHLCSARQGGLTTERTEFAETIRRAARSAVIDRSRCEHVSASPFWR